MRCSMGDKGVYREGQTGPRWGNRKTWHKDGGQMGSRDGGQ